VGFTGRRAEMRWSNFGKVLCEENKITDTVYSNKSQRTQLTFGGLLEKTVSVFLAWAGHMGLVGIKLARRR
jgi:hypothetical protein